MNQNVEYAPQVIRQLYRVLYTYMGDLIDSKITVEKSINDTFY